MKIGHNMNADSQSAFFERKEIRNVRRKLVPALEANGNSAFRRHQGVSDLNVKRKPASLRINGLRAHK
jgi:hypothetical protein